MRAVKGRLRSPARPLSGGTPRSRRAERWRARCGTASGCRHPRGTSGRRQINTEVKSQKEGKKKHNPPLPGGLDAPWCGYAGEGMAQILGLRGSVPASSCRRWQRRRRRQVRPARRSGSSRFSLWETISERETEAPGEALEANETIAAASLVHISNTTWSLSFWALSRGTCAGRLVKLKGPKLRTWRRRCVLFWRGEGEDALTSSLVAGV